jgi:hypothetical protein
MSIYTEPFTYLIGWTAHKKFYYGVRYKKGSDPSSLWTTYFTSSKHVQKFREEHGEPDLVEVRKTFEDTSSAREWEHKVLRRLNAPKRADFLNRSNARAVTTQGYKFDPEVVARRNAKTAETLRGHKQTKETCLKKSISHTGLEFSESHRANISKVRTGMKFSPEHRKNISLSSTGRTQSSESKKKKSDSAKAFFQSDASLEYRKAASERAKKRWDEWRKSHSS